MRFPESSHVLDTFRKFNSVASYKKEEEEEERNKKEEEEKEITLAVLIKITFNRADILRVSVHSFRERPGVLPLRFRDTQQLFMKPKRGGNLHISESFPLRNCARYTFYIFTYHTNEFLKFSNLIPVTHTNNLKALIT